MWPEADRWRAPINDFPPRWASAWGDDQFGLWADLTVNGVTQGMRWIEPGDFVMGSSDAERGQLKDKAARDWADAREKPQHRVEISEGFWLADTPCTQAFWVAINGKQLSRFPQGALAEHRPVAQLSWDDVESFLTLLSSLVPEAVAMLPTEAQWEYACRAGTQTAYWWGDEADSTRANMAEKAKKSKQTSDVKTHKANPWGLFDVHGNVWEWCSDARRAYGDQSEFDPGGGRKGEKRVLRGGSWNRSAAHARSASRNDRHFSAGWGSSGFRFALISPSPGGGAAGR
jgi:formylglycine-generating enzyme